MRACKLPLWLALAALIVGSVVGGGVPAAAAESPAPIECEGDSCQPLPPPPEEPVLGTAFFTPEVNPPPHIAKPPGRSVKKGHRHHHADRRRR